MSHISLRDNPDLKTRETLSEGTRHRQVSKMVESDSVKMERLVTLRRSRGGHAGNITRKYNELKQLIDCNAKLCEVTEILKRIQTAFIDFQKVHTDFMTLVREVLPDKVVDEEMLFHDIKEKYDDAKEKYNNFSEQCRLQEEVQPNDSASQVGSRATSQVSTTSSARAKAAAKRAALQARVRALQELQELELGQLKIEQEKKKIELRRQRLELKAELEAAAAEEEVLARFAGESDHITKGSKVLADGEIFDGLSSLRKDNTGYDLKQLLIGSEGTLGMITAVCILCPPKPKSVNLALLGCRSFQAVLDTYKFSKEKLGEILSAFELIDCESMKVQVTYGRHVNPLQGETLPFYVVVETSGSNEDHDELKMSSFLEEVMEKGYVEDGTIASDSTKFQSMWRLRESIAESLMKAGVVYKYDLSFSIEGFYELVEVMREKLKGDALHVCGYGHLGDGNLHLNIVGPTLSKEFLSLIEPYVFEWTSDKGGSISAEHGIGFKKRDAINFSKTEKQIRIMQQVKSVFDPKGILNPYKTIPSSI